MTLLATLLLVLLIIAIVVVVLRDAGAGITPGISNRNIFLVGFIYFQPMSGAITLLFDQNERGLYLNDPGRTGLGFAAICWLFTVLFLVFDRMAKSILVRAAKPRPFVDLSGFGIMCLALIGIAVGLLCRFVLGYVPILGVITVQLSVGVLTASCCLMAYQWAKNMWNGPAIAVFLFCLTATVAALLVNAFGRREILGVFMSIAWMLYFLKWRSLPRGQLVARSFFWITLILGVMVVFSAARSGKEKERTVGDYVQAIGRLSTEDLVEQVVGGVGGQFAGGTSMWVYETRPENYAYEPLHSLVYFVTFPVPRQYWSEKPNSLGRNITIQSGVGGVTVGEHSFGPGLVGHVVNDFPPIALPLYAALLAFLLRYLDLRLAGNAWNPFEMCILGSGTAQIFAVARGELALFVINALGTMAGAWLLVRWFPPLLSGFTQHESDEHDASGETQITEPASVSA